MCCSTLLSLCSTLLCTHCAARELPRELSKWLVYVCVCQQHVQFVQLTVKYGEKKRANWMKLMSELMVIDGQPTKKNQTTAMHVGRAVECGSVRTICRISTIQKSRKNAKTRSQRHLKPITYALTVWWAE